MNPRVLIVDDDLEFTELVEHNLRRYGCEVVVAQNGIQGLRVARTDSPDTIVLDLMMPDLDGLSVCEILQTQPSTRDIPVFIVSALDQSWVKTRRSRAKFAAYFTKPLKLNLLKECVLSVCDQRLAIIRSRLAQSPD